MNTGFFYKKTQKHMSFLKSKYFFDVTVGDEIIKYHKAAIVILVSMDNFFEISIVFSNNIDNELINFIDILEYLKFDKRVVELAKHNQCTEKTIDNFYLNILPYLDDVVSILLKNQLIFKDCIEFVLSKRKLLLKEEETKKLQKKLNVIWEKQDYSGYVSTFEEYESLIKLDKIFHKKNSYAKKQLIKTNNSKKG